MSKITDARVEFGTLREANVARQKDWCPDQLPDLSFRGNELAGETGEVCNVIKKLERERLGWRGSRDTVAHLAEELGDVVICADLVAISAGIDLDAAVAAKFNATSEKVGLPHRITELRALRSKSEAYAWEGYWPGAGSIDSITSHTKSRATMERWIAEGAEITPLYTHPAPQEADWRADILNNEAVLEAAPQEAVGVKALEWFERSGGYVMAKPKYWSAGYTIIATGSQVSWQFDLEMEWRDAPTVEAAKTAAQAHYAAIILPTLTHPASATEDQAMTEITQVKLDDAIDAGIAAVDLYEIANEDLINRSHLETFLRAALAALTHPAPATGVSDARILEVLKPFADLIGLIAADDDDEYTPDWSPFIPLKAYRAAAALVAVLTEEGA